MKTISGTKIGKILDYPTVLLGKGEHLSLKVVLYTSTAGILIIYKTTRFIQN